tara:strand:- start:280 stop:783 length:504 start_codon:yes stop_codon:yes gene_type:complete
MKLIDAIKGGDASVVCQLLKSGEDVDARVNEYSELPGLAAYGAVPQVTLIAYVIQAVVHGGADRQAALRMADVLLNVNRRHGRYAGASLDATFMMMVEGLWEDRNHNEYTYKIREHAVPVTVEAYIRSLLPTYEGQEADFLGAILNLILVAKAREAANHLLASACPA